MKIYYLYLTPRQPLIADITKHKEPTTFLYGLDTLKKLKHEVYFSDRAYENKNIFFYMCLFIEKIHAFLLGYPLGFRIYQAILLYNEFKKADLIICTQDSAGLPIAFFKKIGFINNNVLYISNNLVNAIINPRFSFMKKLLVSVLRSTDHIIVYSKHEKKILETLLNKTVNYIPFGIDSNFYIPNNNLKKNIDVLTVGRDKFRDYKTLFLAVKNTNLSVSVICEQKHIRSLTIPSNVTIISNVNGTRLKNYYNRSKIVILPLHNTLKSQGQTVLLEALAMDKKIIVTNVPGIKFAFNLKKFPNILCVPPHNPTAIKKAINKHLKTSRVIKLSPKLRDEISSKRYVMNILNILKN